MIPDSMIAACPELGKKVTELANKRICRFCLSQTEDLVNIVEISEGSKKAKWIMMSTTCLAAVSSLIGERFPKYVCNGCYEFVKKCYEFHKLRKKAEIMLLIYPLTGSWSQSLDVPEWLRSTKKRKRGEVIVDSPPVKKVCSRERKDAQVQTNSLEELKKLLDVPVESSPVNHEPLGLQSPAITSEDTLQATVILKRIPQLSGANQLFNLQSQQCFEAKYSTQTVIQYGRSQPIQHHSQPLQNINNSQYPVNLSTTQCHLPPSSASVQTTRLDAKPQQLIVTNPVLRKLLQQSQQSVNLPFQPPKSNTASVKTPTYAPLQLQPCYKPPSQNSTIQQPPSIPHPPIQPNTYLPPPPFLYHCSVCPDRFVNPNHLSFHMRKHDDSSATNGKFCCAGCEDQLLNLTAFVVHLERKHLDSRFCFLCGKQVDNTVAKLKHLQYHLEAQMTFACNFCLLIFISSASRLKHVNLLHRSELCQAVSQRKSVVKSCCEEKVEK